MAFHKSVRQIIRNCYNSIRKTISVDVENFSTSAFGEMSVVEKTPQVQMKFPYGVNSRIGQKLTNNAGSTVTSTQGYAKITCAGAYPAFSQIRTLDTLRYGSGQGAEFIGSCAWITGGVALSSQVFGPGDDDEGYFFGFNGTSFGILHRSGGSLEIKSLTITSAATGTGNITITIDGTAVVVAITSGDTIAQITEKIVDEAAAFGNAGRGWEVHTDDNLSVEFISLVAEVTDGTFSFVDTDTTGVTADAFSQSVTGVEPTETWVAQSAWNVDAMDGTGLSQMILDTTKINVFKVQFQHGGMITFGIENSETGKFQIVHQIKYANSAVIPAVINPTFYLTIIAKTESGYSGSALEMRTSSMGGFIEGKEAISGVRNAISTEKSMTTTRQVLLIIHNEIDFNSTINRIAVFPDFLTLATEAGKPVEMQIISNPTRIDGAATLTNINGGSSVMQWGNDGSTITGGDELAVFEVESGSPVELDFSAFDVRLRPGDRWVITGQIASGQAALCKAGISWNERV